MAENAPPPINAANAAADPSRGMPYYEKLRRDLRDTLQKKRILDQNMANLEESIFKVETTYLEETTAGNIIKGFDNYIKGSAGVGSTAGTGAGTASRRKGGITDADRVFSRSSASFSRDSPAPTSAQTTPSHAPTPTSSFPQSTRESNQPTPNGTVNKAQAGNRKKKAGATQAEKEEDDADGKPAKRGKITYGRD